MTRARTLSKLGSSPAEISEGAVVAGITTIDASGVNITGVVTATTGTFTSVSVAGTITYDDVTNIDSVGIVTAGKGLRATTGGLIVTAGVSTFTGAADFNGALDVDGHTELDNLNVSGVSTFAGYTTVGPYASATASANGVQLRDNGEVLMNKNSGDAITIYNNSATKTFVVGADGDIDIAASDGTSKVSILNTGSATFAGNIDLTDSTVDLYSQTTTTSSKTFQLFSDVGGTKVEKASITAAGAATFASISNTGAVQIGENAGSAGNDEDGIYLDPNGTVYSFKAAASTTPFFQAYQYNGQKMAEITSAGAATFAGSVKIGGTAEANEIDEYEEGTWTPTFEGSTSGSGTLTNYGAWYTRIGRAVHFYCYIVCTGLGTISGNIKVAGLPFTVHATGGYQAVIFSAVEGLAITAGESLAGYCEINDDAFTLQLWDATTGTSNLTSAELSADGGFIASGTYFA